MVSATTTDRAEIAGPLPGLPGTGPEDVVLRVVSAVQSKLGSGVDPGLLEDTARRVVIELTEGARVVDYVPVLAERLVRERLRSPV